MKIICENCGIEAQTKYVKFYQNIGMLIIRQTKTIEGNFCKLCIHKNFWKFFLITLFLGWWGIISFLITPFFLINNIFRYIMNLGMESVPKHAKIPQLTNEVIEKLQPLTEHIINRLNSNEDVDTILKSISLETELIPGQVYLYILKIINEQNENTNSMS